MHKKVESWIEWLFIPMIVHPRTIQSTDSDTASDGARAFLESQALRSTGASMSTIEALEKIKTDKDSSRQCVVCLEDISIGTEATRMPNSWFWIESPE